MSFTVLTNELKALVLEWEQRLSVLNESTISIPKNSQNRSIKMIIGHMIDSASNNTHRVIHLQYRATPIDFPNYASYGNNDKWISIQNYQNENWEDLLQLWKYSHLHYIYIVQNINSAKLNAQWIADKNEMVSLQDMVEDFPRHFDLHISEIKELLNQQYYEES